jgi:MerR family Zn(II)-responsive transcriptional regulator of zntA
MKPSSNSPARAASALAKKAEGAAAKDPATYTTGEMARLSNSTLRTVRFYEEAGILQPIGRTDGGHRVFERCQLDRLMLVSDMREAGMSLEQIRSLLEIKQHAATGGLAADDAVRALRGHVEELTAKMEVLRRLADDLTRTIASTQNCLECKDGNLFPLQCKDCDRLSKSEPLPRGMRVLWGVSTKPTGG